MTNPGQTYEVKMTLSPQQEVYRPGDKFTLSFTASQDCHVALIDVGTSGEITVLFPDHGFGETGEVKAGQEVILECEVGGPGGLDSIRAIATQQKVDFESLLKDLGAKDTKRINRVGQGVADKPVNTWSTSILTYRIEDFH
jgi:hypothetical protein